MPGIGDGRRGALYGRLFFAGHLMVCRVCAGQFTLCRRAGALVPGWIRADSEWVTAAMGLTSLKRRQA
jgi:hypothetical protein